MVPFTYRPHRNFRKKQLDTSRIVVSLHVDICVIAARFVESPNLTGRGKQTTQNSLQFLVDEPRRLFFQSNQMSTSTECRLLHSPSTEELRFLPEGPYSLDDGIISWVGIQHGANATAGSVNLLNVNEATNTSFDLPGRPGFAFPTTEPTEFVCGVERCLGRFSTRDRSWTSIVEGVDDHVTNTIINDGVVYEDNLVFGCKDLEFQTKKAGLYLWRGRDEELIRLRDNQICSNGKAIIRDTEHVTWLIDIDSPTKTVTRGRLDIENGLLDRQDVILDLTAEDRFPDGMIVTPDSKSLIIAFYDPGDPPFGIARQYNLETAAVEHEWRCPGSPRVTCPQLMRLNNEVKLVLTTAVEHMEQEQRERHANAGSLFVGDTSFESTGDQPVFTG